MPRRSQSSARYLLADGPSHKLNTWPWGHSAGRQELGLSLHHKPPQHSETYLSFSSPKPPNCTFIP